jgi:hypothetical protein
MPDYRLFFFDGDRVVDCRSLSAPDDAIALALSEDVVGCAAAELWRAGYKLGEWRPAAISVEDLLGSTPD